MAEGIVLRGSVRAASLLALAKTLPDRLKGPLFPSHSHDHRSAYSAGLNVRQPPPPKLPSQSELERRISRNSDQVRSSSCGSEAVGLRLGTIR